MSLAEVPDEIIKQILHHVSPEDTLSNVQLTSRRLYHLANEPLLWKRYCQSAFKFWHPKHQFHKKLRKRVSDVPWKQIFIIRLSRNARASRLLDEGIQTKVGRMRRFEQICKLGYDAKDLLLEASRIDDTAEDVLARRFWTRSLLNSIHRTIAIEEWHSLRMSSETSMPNSSSRVLERVLGAFDMFVLYDQPGDIDDISQILDEWTVEFRRHNPYLESMTLREKALALNRWLRTNNFTGLHDPERNYRNLRNCFIGQALRDEKHDSLPIISSAIFCCMAERLGIRAQCCAFPSHVHVVILSEPGLTLDGQLADANKPTDKMYLDPYGFDGEISLATLEEQLANLGWQDNAEVFLAPVPPSSIVVRTAHNIKATYMRASRASELGEEADPELTRLTAGHDGMNLASSHYAAMWVTLLFSPVNALDWSDNLNGLLRRFSKNWPEDTWLIEKYLCPLYDRLVPLHERFTRHGPRGWDDPRRVLNLVRDLDLQTPPLYRRDQNGNQDVKYKVGQVFRHRRYRWLGVINGWTDRNRRRLPIPDAAPMDEGLSDTDLPSARPRNQTFYTSLRPIGMDRHIIAEDNIELVHDPDGIPDSLFQLAGKFFKRFDRETCRFISNLKDEYPSD